MTAIELPEAYLAMPRWGWDEAGAEWVADLPATVADHCLRWGLEVDGEVWHGSNAVVVPVRRAGERLALRLAPPGDDTATEAAALRFWDGRGTVLLVDGDVEHRALLLERLDGDRTLADEPLTVALPVLAGLMATLAVPAPEDVSSTRDHARGCAASFETEWERLGRPVDRTLLDRAVAAARRLAAVDPGGLAANGDLHHEQVVAGSRGWVVVDPVLLRGDREYDLARVLWTRLDEFADDAAIRSGAETMIRIADVPADRARDWIVARSMSYLLWGLDHGLTLDPPRCVRLLELFA